MAQSKHTKPTPKKPTTNANQTTNAKHALKKQQKQKQKQKQKHLSASASKSRNEDIREQLDRDALSVHSELRALVDQRQPLAPAPGPAMDVSQSLSDLTTTLGNL